MGHYFSSVVALRGTSQDGKRELLLTLCIYCPILQVGKAHSFALVGTLLCGLLVVERLLGLSWLWGEGRSL